MLARFLLPIRFCFWILVAALTTGFSGIPVSLPGMSAFSAQIFAGELVSMEKTDLEFKYENEVWISPGRRLEFRVSEWVHGGELPKDTTLFVLQEESSASPMAVGDKVLWFLSAPNHVGAQVPMGLESGFFRIYRGQFGDVALSLNLNTLLWDSAVPLWETHRRCRKGQYRRELKKIFPERKDRKRWMELTERGYARQPLPLGVVLAIARSCVPKKPDEPAAKD